MPPPPPLSIATNALTRLLKEESSYRTELAAQQERVRRLQDGAEEVDGDEDEEEGGNREFRMRQEIQAVRETEKVFGALGERIRGAVGRVEGLLAESGSAEGAEVDAANDALARAKGRA